jgi:enamine deaminase RidA (YjgF/YER057c/UK114 family)
MSSDEIRVLGWPAPRGYANGRTGRGTAVHVAGQIGWDDQGAMATGLVDQFARAVDNVIAVVHAAGGTASDIATMTVFVTDIEAYRSGVREIGAAWRGSMGRHFPAITLVAVSALVEPSALVEIQATAYIGSGP